LLGRVIGRFEHLARTIHLRKTPQTEKSLKRLFSEVQRQ
jgi:hypothetical protein